MEIKSNNVLIGSFAIAAILGIFLFALWIGRVQLDRTYAYYEILFADSVSGLTESGTVQYSGIPVGRVISLTLDDDDPSKVVALIEVDARTPVKEDSVAKLELFGLTGVALIELSGGSAESALLTAKPGQAYPVIEAAPSAFQELFMSAPDAVENANLLIAELRLLVNKNERSITTTLENVASLSTELAKTAKSIESLSATADDVLDNDVRLLVSNAQGTIASYKNVADNLDAILVSNQTSIDSFARDGLGQLPRLIDEMRTLVASLERFVARAEGDPAQFLLGRDTPEYQP